MGIKATINLVEFYVYPHLNSEYFHNIRKEKVLEITKSDKRKIYVLDDQSAVLVNDKVIEVISEGEWFSIN